MMAEQYSLRWNNYSSHISGAFDSLRNEEDLVDVTLCCDGGKIRAHKIILSACSPYFRELFKENPCQHPIVILRSVQYIDLHAIITFMYQGEANVIGDHLISFLQTAEMLQVRGLTDSGRETPEPKQIEHFGPNLPVIPKEIMKVKSTIAKNTSCISDSLFRKTSLAASENQKVNGKRRKLNDEQPLVISENNRIDSPTKQVPNSPSMSPNAYSQHEKSDLDQAEASDDIQDNSEFKYRRNSFADDTNISSILLQRFTESSEQIPLGDSAESVNQTITSGDLDGKTKYPCPLCLKVFRHRDSLRQHHQTHTGGTKCPICASVMSRKYELKVHMRKKHDIYT